mmetsp:Transcript_9892/g.20916  ORF Transcript_9892/g.20916 Transcript_9892/m.20916 type:complete len:280 (-) Transcript_9892:314-1153(-)|eukprot:CAMPEP_0183306166 /NCGR_PEP_ID=MMETSP0160_2-20130417/10675_1 /TAXON_ID=2839 ORGANISM="Odontella Sinensis, Strain Grunow 1884" /NCGR_SAMPLE_ID=MMETSP0160_2 /ASSEMBLY_ACC=CAM_ASM_000250 /LENGTH=279 /DNA_ID=CAMNT_0025469487 /DNA_START=297 /DNA_END=1136 /DNA_ORIENTATION=+
MVLFPGRATVCLVVCTLVCSSAGLVTKQNGPKAPDIEIGTCRNRRALLITLTSGIAFNGCASAAETVGKDPNCNGPSCIGVWDGLLADCPHGNLAMNARAGCASSQDDTPGVFAEPWDYSESNSLDWEIQMKRLLPAIQIVAGRRGDAVEVLMQSGRYLRVLFTDTKSGEQSLGEFYFTENDATVQFRVGSLSSGLSSVSLKNLQRCEMIRKELRYLKLPVLRNRKRSLFFIESDFDTFGPGSAALGPPAEMSSGDLEERQEVDPKLRIDVLQGFPVAK